MAIGLEDVVAAETALSDVDGLAGRLIIRGHSLDELAGRTTFEDVVALLLDGAFDETFSAEALGKARVEMFFRFGARIARLRALPVFDAVRAAIAKIADGSDLTTALHLLAAPAVLVPAVLRTAQGREAVAPDPKLAHAADILRMLSGERRRRRWPHGARHLPGDRLRSRPQRLDLRGARRRLDAGRA